MREIGGKTARFGFTIAVCDLFSRFFSIDQRNALCFASRRASSYPARILRAEGCPACPPARHPPLVFCFGSFAFAGTAALRAAADPRAAGLRAAVLLLVFVAIVVRLKFCSWPELP